MSNQSEKRVLIAPLDWGLGHATRCIPVIQSLISHGIKIYIAAEGRIKNLLKNEFPNAVFLPLPEYKIRYAKSARVLPFIIGIQLPKILKRIRQEHIWLQKIIETHRLDAIISDNRFGLFSKKIPCIYITHQLSVFTGNFLADRIATQLHQSIMGKYDQCWIPDAASNGLAGKLSHPKKIPANARYIGPLSRLEPLVLEKKYEWLISLSGPEPQRTILEKKIFSQLPFLEGNILIIRGLPGENTVMEVPSNVTIHNHLSASQFNRAVALSDKIICRSGYTSIMDLVKMKKKALLIPTPGQAEQEYLGEYLSEQKYFPCVMQKDFSLKDAKQILDGFNFRQPDFVMDQYKIVISEFVASLKSGNFASQ